MKELRVALFTGNYNHIKDGVSLTLNRLVDFLEKQGVEVLIFGPTIKKPALNHNGRLVPAPSMKMPVGGRGEYRLSLGFSSHAKEELEAFNPDLIHIATPDALGYQALKWAKEHQVQVVSSYHTHFTSYLKYYKLSALEFLAWRYLGWFYNSCTHVYVPSQSMIDELRRHEINSEMKIWARGVDTNLFSPQKRDEKWRVQQGFKKDDIVVTFVSRLVWEKELATFIYSLKRVSEKGRKVKALIVGDGPAKGELKQQLPEAVFTGFLEGEDLAKAYASSDVFLFPSHTETFGNVTLEAMSSGLPCVVADAIGSKSLVEDGVNGFLAKPSSKFDFTLKLEDLVSNEQLRNKMKKTSRQKALRYDWDDINSILLEYYKEALLLPVPQKEY